MSEGHDEPPKLSRPRSVASFIVLAGVALAGYAATAAWPAIFVGAVALLFASDRGQHRWLADRFQNMPRDYVVGLSVGAHVLNDLLFTTLMFSLGRATRLFWWDVMSGTPGAWGELAWWLGMTVIVIGVGQVVWWWLGRAGRH